MNKDSKFEEYLLSILYSLNGKLTKSDFNKIVKHYKWDFNFKKIHIVGTNGKGSNATYINNELIENGYKVGLFTSPHLKSMYERIKVNNKNIPFESLTKFVADLKSNFSNINFGWFDVFFLSSLYWFHNNSVDVAIFEAGIGAKKDVVNYLNHDYLIITSISYDHENKLGNSLEKIAIDKSYAIKKHQKVYINSLIDKNLIKIFKLKANEKEAHFNIIKTDSFTFETINKSLSQSFLKNEFNIKNFKTNFKLPLGRIEKFRFNNLDHYIDIAHNIESFEQTINYFEKHNIEFDQIVVSLSNDKDDKKIFSFLTTKFEKIYVYENKGPKPKKLFSYDEKFIRILDLKKFIINLKAKTLFIGSFYLASEILQNF